MKSATGSSEREHEGEFNGTKGKRTVTSPSWYGSDPPVQLKGRPGHASQEGPQSSLCHSEWASFHSSHKQASAVSGCREQRFTFHAMLERGRRGWPGRPYSPCWPRNQTAGQPLSSPPPAPCSRATGVGGGGACHTDGCQTPCLKVAHITPTRRLAEHHNETRGRPRPRGREDFKPRRCPEARTGRSTTGTTSSAVGAVCPWVRLRHSGTEVWKQPHGPALE